MAEETGPVRSLGDLASMEPLTPLDKAQLAAHLCVDKRTIDNMCDRHELPPPVALGNRKIWLAGKILEFLADRADQEAAQAKRMTARIPR